MTWCIIHLLIHSVTYPFSDLCFPSPGSSLSSSPGCCLQRLHQILPVTTTTTVVRHNNNRHTTQQQQTQTQQQQQQSDTTSNVRHTCIICIIVWNKLFTAFTFLHFVAYIYIKIKLLSHDYKNFIWKWKGKNTDCLEINNKNILLQFISHFNFQTIFCAIAYMY